MVRKGCLVRLDVGTKKELGKGERWEGREKDFGCCGEEGREREEEGTLGREKGRDSLLLCWRERTEGL